MAFAASLLLIGCAHRPDPERGVFISPTCPAKAYFVNGRTKCSIGIDGKKWCRDVQVEETCRRPKADVPK